MGLLKEREQHVYFAGHFDGSLALIFELKGKVQS
jgi:hypothetical protein